VIRISQTAPGTKQRQLECGRRLGRAEKLRNWTRLVGKVTASYPSPPIVSHRICHAFSARSQPVKTMDNGNRWDGGQVRTKGTYRVDDCISRCNRFKSVGSRLCARQEQFSQPQPASSPPPHVAKYNPVEGLTGQDLHPPPLPPNRSSAKDSSDTCDGG
jgi:hypothetical protein